MNNQELKTSLINVLTGSERLLENVPVVESMVLNLRSSTKLSGIMFDEKGEEVLVMDDDNESQENAEISPSYVQIGDMRYDTSVIRDNNNNVDDSEVAQSTKMHCDITNRNDNINGSRGISVVTNVKIPAYAALSRKLKELLTLVSMGIRYESYIDNSSAYMNNKIFIALKEAGYDSKVIEKVFPYVEAGDMRVDFSTYSIYRTTDNIDSDEFPFAFSNPEGTEPRKIWTKKVDNKTMKFSKDNTRMNPVKINVSRRYSRILSPILQSISRAQLAIAYTCSTRNSKNGSYDEQRLMDWFEECIDKYYESGLPTDFSELDNMLKFDQNYFAIEYERVASLVQKAKAIDTVEAM